MSKKVIINKYLMEDIKFREFILAADFSKTLKRELEKQETPLSKNPSFPNEDMPFDLRMTLLRFKETKDTLKRIGEIDEDINDGSILPYLIEKCKRLERPFRRQLEKLAYNFIIDTFKIPEGVVNLIVDITDDLSNTTLSVRVQAEEVDFEYNDVKHKKRMHSEVHKRRLMDAFMSGAALRFAANIKKYAEDIYDINPKLLTLYRDIIAVNEYMLFNVDKIEINDKNKNQLGLSNIIIGNRHMKSEVRVEAVIFPILIYELVKAFLELSSAHGLPKDKQEAMYVMQKSDFLQAEPWYMRIGPALFDMLKEAMGDKYSDESLPYIFKMLSQLDTDDFEYVMQEILSKTKTAKKIINRMILSYEEEAYEDENAPTMAKANVEVNIINDEVLHESQIKNKELLTEITCSDAYQRIYSKFVPQEDYLKIISATQGTNTTVLSGDARWVLELYKRKSPHLMEDLYKLRNERGEGYLQIFNRLKDTRRLSPEEANIFNYKSISELGAFTSQWDIADVWETSRERRKNSMRPEFVNAKNDIKVVYEDESWLILIPNSYEASCYWGDGTEWCTAYKDSRNYYDDYSSEGPLYININQYNKEKYQFHFESNSFKDMNDRDVESPILYHIDASDGMIDFYSNLLLEANNYEAFFRLYAPQEGELPFGVFEINNEIVYLDYRRERVVRLDYVERASYEWEQIDGFYANEP